MSKIIFSCQADFHGVALQEILGVSAGLKFVKWLGDGVGLLEYDRAFPEFSALVNKSKLIFTRHIFPAEYIIKVGELEFLQDFISRINADEDFSVQLRAVKLSETEIKHKLADYFKSRGFTENKRYPKQVISVFIADNFIYAGLSRADENLSIWSGGMRHYAMREDTISRAGFKLMEALEAYHINFKEGSVALDLGAAPGGWTKVLLEQGLRVVAVDPVQLAPALQADNNVEYYNMRAHEYIKSSSKVFDLIVNDMSMNIFMSINFMLSLKRRLHDNGHIIITFKLTKQDRLNKINEGLSVLSRDFKPVFVKQLFHNRSEVTVILQKK